MFPDWREIPEIVIHEDARQLVVNGSIICAHPDNVKILRDVRNHQPSARLESITRKAAALLFKANRPPEPFRIRNQSDLQDLLAAPGQSDALVRLKAVLAAASLHVADCFRRERRFIREPITSTPQLGSVSYFVTPRKEGLSPPRNSLTSTAPKPSENPSPAA